MMGNIFPVVMQHALKFFFLVSFHIQLWVVLEIGGFLLTEKEEKRYRA